MQRPTGKSVAISGLFVLCFVVVFVLVDLVADITVPKTRRLSTRDSPKKTRNWGLCGVFESQKRIFLL